MAVRLAAACTPGHSGRRARGGLRQGRPEGQAQRTAAASAAATGPGDADHEGAELPAIKRGTLQIDQRKHELTCALLVTGADVRSARHGRLADATSKELLRGQEAGLSWASGPFVFNLFVNFRVFLWFSSTLFLL